MLATERHNLILELLEKKNIVKNKEFVELLNVSLETVRRDLELLDKQGLLNKVHGGATYVKNLTKTVPFLSRLSSNINLKIELANKAFEYIEEGDIIALNNSTTNLELAKKIKKRDMDITVITNSLSIASEFSNAKNINLILAGGIYYPQETAFLGQITADFLSNFSANKCFITCGGISKKKGISDFYIEEVLVEKKMIEISEKTIVLADLTKIENNALFHIADFDSISTLIVDSSVDEKIIEDYLECGVEVVKSFKN